MRTDFFTRVLMLGLMVACAQGQAQQYDFPGINSLGRFLGYGYSHHGYQAAADGRFNVLTRRHPSSDYPSRQLLYPYSPHYQPISQPKSPQPAFMLLPQGAASSPANPNASAKPALPAKPAEPPPEWLEPYLENGSKRSGQVQPPTGSQTAPFYFDSNELAPDSNNSAPIDSNLLPSPSDREVDDDNLLLEGDDSLLLESDDLSSRRNYFAPAINRSRLPSPLNRYKQAMNPSAQR